MVVMSICCFNNASNVKVKVRQEISDVLISLD